MADPITEQLTTYCDCVGINEKDVMDMINVISMATCWTINPCETFLFSHRKEVLDVSCMDCPFVFEPYYYPFDPESFSFKLAVIDGLEETLVDLEYGYSTADETFRVNLGLDCECMTHCGCDPEYRLIVEYDAGYEEIPDCLLPVFCNIMDVIQAKNDCSCGDCNCGSENEEDIQYATGDVVTVALETDIGQLLTNNYQRQLGLISLCRRRKLWGFIV